MVTRRLATLAAAFLFAFALAMPFAPAAHAQTASTQTYWCYDPYWGWYLCW